MRRGFTMIELIFVIVIIGILAAVAIPKLAATRDDAENAKNCANLVTCLTDLAATYTATGTADDTTRACTDASAFYTYTSGDQNVTVSNTPPPNCDVTAGEVITFGGSSISL